MAFPRLPKLRYRNSLKPRRPLIPGSEPWRGAAVAGSVARMDESAYSAIWSMSRWVPIMLPSITEPDAPAQGGGRRDGQKEARQRGCFPRRAGLGSPHGTATDTHTRARDPPEAHPALDPK